MTNLTKTVFGDAEEIFIDDRGFTYYPLLFDKNIEKESAHHRAIKSISGKTYVKGMNLSKIAGSFDKIDKEKYETIKNDLFKRIMPDVNINDIYRSNNCKAIRTIVFEIMPHFIGKNKKRNPLGKTKQKEPTEQSILSMISEKVEIPKRYYEEAGGFCETDEFLDAVRNLNSLRTDRQEFPKGLMETSALEPVLNKAIERCIIGEKVKGLENEIMLKKEMNRKNLDYIATMLYMKDAENFELGNFGFIKNYTGPNYNDLAYAIYVKTGEYALRDFDGKIYLFPSCRVGTGITKEGNIQEDPFVLDEYKHPFLYSWDNNMEICVGDARTRGNSKIEDAIICLEAGVNALLFGYFNEEDFNGYNYLNGTHNAGNSVDFDNYLTSEDDPRIKSGKVPITNDFLIERPFHNYGICKYR